MPLAIATEPVANEESSDFSDSTRRVLLQAQDPVDKFALDNTQLRQQEASEERLRENTELSGIGSDRPKGEVILVRSQFPHTSGKLARVALWILEQAISDERWGAAMGDEVAIRVHGVFPPPMGIEREDRCE